MSNKKIISFICMSFLFSTCDIVDCKEENSIHNNKNDENDLYYCDDKRGKIMKGDRDHSKSFFFCIVQRKIKDFSDKCSFTYENVIEYEMQGYFDVDIRTENRRESFSFEEYNKMKGLVRYKLGNYNIVLSKYWYAKIWPAMLLSMLLSIFLFLEGLIFISCYFSYAFLSEYFPSLFKSSARNPVLLPRVILFTSLPLLSLFLFYHHSIVAVLFTLPFLLGVVGGVINNVFYISL